MKPPVGLTRKDLDKAILTHAVEHYCKHKGNIVCAKCGSKIEMALGTASVCFDRHMEGKPCGGGGDTERFVLPYCPTCEGEPTETATCIHTHAPLPKEVAAAPVV